MLRTFGTFGTHPGTSGTVRTLGTAIALTIACSSPPDPRRTEGEGVKRVEMDQNKNGRADTFVYWEGARMVRAEIDTDEDGRIERWEHYTEANTLERVGTSSKGDGVEDTWSYPDPAGLLLKEERDTDRDGVVDKRDIYVAAPGSAASRVLAIVELGLDKAGKPERRLYYKPDGSFDKVEVVR